MSRAVTLSTAVYLQWCDTHLGKHVLVSLKTSSLQSWPLCGQGLKYVLQWLVHVPLSLVSSDDETQRGCSGACPPQGMQRYHGDPTLGIRQSYRKELQNLCKT